MNAYTEPDYRSSALVTIDTQFDTLVFSGCNFPNCPRTSIYEASERDYRVVLAEDAVSGLYPKGKEEMLNIGVRVLETASIKSAIMGA
jgi:nicotinamidase-related amidase